MGWNVPQDGTEPTHSSRGSFRSCRRRLKAPPTTSLDPTTPAGVGCASSAQDTAREAEP